MLGHLHEDSRQSFYEHLKKCTPWKNHPVLCKEGVDYKTLIPVTLHGDGAQFYREDDFFCWSWSSAWSFKGHIKDPMLIKYPIAIIPERCMKKKSEPRLSFKNTFCFFKMSPYFLGPLHSHESMHRPEPLSVVRYAPLSTRSSLRWRRGHSPFWLMAPFLGWGSMVKSCKLAHTGGNFRGNKLLKGGSFLANF